MFSLSSSKFTILGVRIMDLTKNLNRSASEESVLNATNQIAKQPLRKLQFALNRISKVVNLHLTLLKKQRANINMYQKAEQHDKLHAELINASRTIQQLKQDMYELEIVRQQVTDEDLAQFDQDVRTIQTNITLEITIFINSHSDALEPGSSLRSSIDDPSIRQRNFSTSVRVSNSGSAESSGMFGEVGDLESPWNEDVTMSLDAAQTQVSKQKSTMKSWSYLRKEISELNSLMSGFAKVVMSHKETLNNIEGNVDVAHENVSEGTGFLDKAARYKMAMWPVTGALVGCLVGGPVGLVAGLKVGGVAAVGGSVLGYTGGRILQKRKVDTKPDIELKDLKTSLSMNDLHKD